MEPSGKGNAGDGDVGYRTACLRLPRFPLQLLCRQRPEWSAEKVAWLSELKADAPIHYLSREALAAGLEPGVRYATALGLVPDLLAGTSSTEQLKAAEQRIVRHLRRFTPNIRRGSEFLESGVYLLDASGLHRAFGCMENWAQQLCHQFARAGWEVRVAVGFTPFATELATYHLKETRPWRLFRDRAEEQAQTMGTPLSFFSLSPDQVRRLKRFGVVVLEDFLALNAEDVKRRFGPDFVEFYARASEALFAEFEPLPEQQPVMESFGFAQPVSDLEAILEVTRQLLVPLLQQLARREEGVGELHLCLLTEDGGRRRERLCPSVPTQDVRSLLSLLRLRLESHFQKHPLAWGRRVERVVLLLRGEPDPEKQGELFRGFLVESEDQALVPRDMEAALWALSRVRAEFGEASLGRAELLDHHLPGKNYAWRAERESLDWLRPAPSASLEQAPEGDLRVRRHLSRRVYMSTRDRWKDKLGPFPLSGGWWEDSYDRDYFFVREGTQTGWLHWDREGQKWFAEGWLQ